MKHLVILCFVLGLAGCELGDRDNKRALGTLVGLGLGAALGYSISGSSFRDQFMTTTLTAAGGAAGTGGSNPSESIHWGDPEGSRVNNNGDPGGGVGGRGY